MDEESVMQILENIESCLNSTFRAAQKQPRCFYMMRDLTEVVFFPPTLRQSKRHFTTFNVMVV